MSLRSSDHQTVNSYKVIICFSWFSYERCKEKPGINSGISYLKRHLSSEDEFVLFEQSSCGVNEHWECNAVDQVVYSEFHFFCRFSLVDSLLKHHIECLKNRNKNRDLKIFLDQKWGMCGCAGNITCHRIPAQRLFYNWPWEKTGRSGWSCWGRSIWSNTVMIVQLLVCTARGLRWSWPL